MSSAVRDRFELVGATLEGRFAIERVVAKGGFGIVYRGLHLALRKPIALKVLFTPDDLSAPERGLFFEGFTQEARTIASLDHPAIVRVFDFGIARAPNGQDAPWMALEWIEGQTLGEFLKARRGERMPPAEALAILRPVFQALGFAHEQRVTHRDVKPSNIMLTPERGGARSGLVHTRLLDFGIAKEMAPDETVGTGETSTHALVSAFSLPYASPEQKAGMKTGPWTDVHALGLILTEMLTGHQPYPGADRIEIEQRVMSSSRPTPALFGVNVGPWEPILAKAVALRSPDRYRDAGSFLAELEASLDGASRAAIPPGATHPAAPLSAPPPLVTYTDASFTGAVSPATLTGSPTTSIAPDPPSPRDRPRRVAALAGGGVFLVALVGVTRASLLSTPAAQPASAAVVSAHPLRALAIDAGSPAPSIVVARPDDVPSASANPVAPTVVPESSPAATLSARATSRRHSGHATGHHASGHRRPD